ncbi:MAG: 4-hydroxythreonine-4-phosphate dehydrogenase PdxA [Desulfobacterales bacterium]|nr:4-hydroxythreonine-4-phosphate dehydrogenase PdxA [Desulfobacterales bacterium]
MNKKRPLIGITMGDPVGIGPEISLMALSRKSIYNLCRPLVIGDMQILEFTLKILNINLNINPVNLPDEGKYAPGTVDILPGKTIFEDTVKWATPTTETGHAMVGYIMTAIDMAMAKKIDAVVTCPINKMAIKMAGYDFNGHTEMLAKKTNTSNYAMMLAGDRLRVVLVTIHTALGNVADMLTVENILRTIQITGHSLRDRFGIKDSKIAVAALNPHAGEGGLFGNEEVELIIPAMEKAKAEGFNVVGPFPPDTLFHYAAKGRYDAVVCMYHDQGLIPFKMIHFENGVNTTLGLPIIRTSVDHGTAYDIAGTGKADPGSLIAAIEMASLQAVNRDIR